MTKNIFLLVFSWHVLADYFFYADSLLLAEKEQNIFGLVKHLFCYALVFLFLNIFIENFSSLILSLVLSHSLIDSFFYFLQQGSQGNDFKVYFINRIASFLSISFIVYFSRSSFSSINYRPLGKSLRDFFHFYALTMDRVLKIFFLLLIIHKPMNIFISQFLASFDIKKNKKDLPSSEEDMRAGRYIGSLERMIILFFIVLEEYTAIAWVLTAKSITRHEDINKDKISGEYYLLGTLMSLLLVVLTAFVLSF